MISARKLQEALRNATVDGIDGICLMTTEGNVVASNFSDRAIDSWTRGDENKVYPDEVSIVAISSSVWNQYATASSNEVHFHLVKLDQGYLGIASVGKSYLIAGVGDVNPGLFRVRLHSLSQFFTKVFEQVKTS